MTDASAHATVIALGDAGRQDDGAGLLVAALLEDCPALRVVIAGGDVQIMIDALRPAKAVFMVDACRGSGLPGTISRYDIQDGILPATAQPTLSSHLIDIPTGLALARELGALPEKLIVFAIEGEHFDFGEGLSAPVDRAARETTRRIQAELEAN